MKSKDSVYSDTIYYALFKSFLNPVLRPFSLKGVPSIFYNFFYRQWKAAFLPGRAPVSSVDHPLDEKIPFVPSWVTIYLDFVCFWVRMLSFLLHRYGRRAFLLVGNFIESMGDLYAFAAEVYKRNFSTTKRPFYIARPRFFLIHLVDPHLMCIPSLHVMVVIRTCTMLSVIARELGEEEKLKDTILEMKQGALAITQAVLFVKQHSINCISAALYAMTCFSPDLFPPKEAEAFVEQLFSPAPPPAAGVKYSRVHPCAAPKTVIGEADKAEIKSHILTLYRQFLAEQKEGAFWGDPLLNFLRK
uniref:Uncharacterized protein n=1 Tax=uncultured bacterium contig00004 TaxID=1181496 RepID=A0A806JXY4_9BACT|nr:hypothetical protein [uncultured bacterium contig00004]